MYCIGLLLSLISFRNIRETVIFLEISRLLETARNRPLSVFTENLRLTSCTWRYRHRFEKYSDEQMRDTFIFFFPFLLCFRWSSRRFNKSPSRRLRGVCVYKYTNSKIALKPEGFEIDVYENARGYRRKTVELDDISCLCLSVKYNATRVFQIALTTRVCVDYGKHSLVLIVSIRSYKIILYTPYDFT